MMRKRLLSRGAAAVAMILTLGACADRAPLEPGSAGASYSAAAATAAALQVAGGDGQIGLVGETLANPLVVRVVDGAGAPVAGRTVSWRATSGGGATVGSTSTSDSAGLARIPWRMVSTAGPATAEAYIYVGSTMVKANFTATAVADGTSRTWTGAISTDWRDQRNWSPEGVPTSRDTVIVGSAANAPVLGVGTTIHRLEIAPAGRLELGGATLAVRTDVLADGPVNGPGKVLINGAGGSLRGRLPALEIAQGSAIPVVTQIDTLWVAGDLTVNAMLDTNGNWSFIGGNLTTASGSSRLKVASGGVLVVDGNASFLRGGGTGLLTRGILKLKGNFTQRGTHSFIGYTGFHTMLIGNTQQVVDFQYGRMSSNRFGHLRIENPAGIRIVNDVAVLANLSEIDEGPIVGTDTLTVGLDFASTGAVELTGLSVGLWIAADSARYRVANTIYTVADTGNFGVARLPYQNLTIRASSNARAIRAEAPLTIRGNLDVAFGQFHTASGAPTTVGGSLSVGNAGKLYLGDMLEVEGGASVRGSAALLSLNGQRLDVYGDLTVAASRGLQMVRPGDEVNVWGSATFQNDQRNAFKDGTLRVRGNFTQTGHYYGFVSEGAHHVVLDGAREQVVTFSDTLGYSYFNRLTVDNRSGVRFGTHTRVRNRLTLLGKATVPSGVVLSIRGYHYTINGQRLFSPATLAWIGDAEFWNHGTTRANDLTSIDQSPLRLTGNPVEHVAN